MVAITVLPDGRVIAKRSTTVIVGVGGGNIPIAIEFTELRKVTDILSWLLYTDPLTDPGTPTNWKISGRTVGCTLMGVAQGTTLTCELVVLGY